MYLVNATFSIMGPRENFDCPIDTTVGKWSDKPAERLDRSFSSRLMGHEHRRALKKSLAQATLHARSHEVVPLSSRLIRSFPDGRTPVVWLRLQWLSLIPRRIDCND